MESRDGPERIAVFGGSFDPPHMGHVQLSLVALSMLDVDRVWWIPTARHAFGKTFRYSLDERMELCRLALRPFGPNAGVHEPPLGRDAMSYTVEELEALNERYPEREFRLLTGADTAATLPRFHRGEELLERWGIDVVGRVGYRLPPLTAGDLRVVGVELPNVSSTEVRERLDAGADCGDLLPLAVWNRVRELGPRSG